MEPVGPAVNGIPARSQGRSRPRRPTYSELAPVAAAVALAVVGEFLSQLYDCSWDICPCTHNGPGSQLCSGDFKHSAQGNTRLITRAARCACSCHSRGCSGRCRDFLVPVLRLLAGSSCVSTNQFLTLVVPTSQFRKLVGTHQFVVELFRSTNSIRSRLVARVCWSDPTWVHHQVYGNTNRCIGLRPFRGRLRPLRGALFRPVTVAPAWPAVAGRWSLLWLARVACSGST